MKHETKNGNGLGMAPAIAELTARRDALFENAKVLAREDKGNESFAAEERAWALDDAIGVLSRFASGALVPSVPDSEDHAVPMSRGEAIAAGEV